MYSAFISPTEKPSNLIDIKRALLTFDKIYLPDPSDRDLMPPQSFGMAMGMPPVLGVNTGPVRVLGKSTGYDDQFNILVDNLKPAVKQGLVEVVSTYNLASSQQFTIGSVDMGNYPLNPRFILMSYRNTAKNQEILKSAIRNDTTLLNAPEEIISEIAIKGGSADGSINDDPHLPFLDAELVREHLREELSAIARARVATVIKVIGYCASKQVIPLFSDKPYIEIVNSINGKATEVLDAASDFDPSWALRTRALKVAHEEYLNEAMLNALSIEDIIKFRTTTWGKQANERDALLASVSEISREAANEVDFEKFVRSKITDYKKTYSDVLKERESLNFNIYCDAHAAVLGLAGASVATNLITQLQTGTGAAGLLIAGCLFAVEKIKDYGLVIQYVKQAEQEFKDNICFGMHNFFNKVSS